jgi:hypothetical protein
VLTDSQLGPQSQISDYDSGADDPLAGPIANLSAGIATVNGWIGIVGSDTVNLTRLNNLKATLQVALDAWSKDGLIFPDTPTLGLYTAAQLAYPPVWTFMSTYAPELAMSVGDTLATAVPDAIEGGAGFLTKIIGQTTANALSGLLGPLWPWLLGVAVIAAVYIAYKAGLFKALVKG